jgi:hypothetical protein
VQSGEGRILSIENLNTVDDPEYDKTLNNIISRVLERVIAEKKSRFYLRTYLRAVHCWRLQEEYWFGGFRFAELFPEDDCSLVNAERLYVIDQNVDAVDIEHAQEVARSETAIIASYLSLILDIGLEEPVHEHRYFLVREGSAFRMLRQSTQLIDTNIPKELPSKGEICRQGAFNGSVFTEIRYATESLTLPDETRRIFKRVGEAASKIQLTFQAACRMYQLSLLLGHNRPTVKASYQYGAIDSIVSSNQNEYGSFTEFMMRYGNADRELCELLHSKVRSAHWHSGNLPLGELTFSHANLLFDPSHMPTWHVKMESHKLMRTAILKWLDEQVGFSCVGEIN